MNHEGELSSSRRFHYGACYYHVVTKRVYIASHWHGRQMETDCWYIESCSVFCGNEESCCNTEIVSCPFLDVVCSLKNHPLAYVADLIGYLGLQRMKISLYCKWVYCTEHQVQGSHWGNLQSSSWHFIPQIPWLDLPVFLYQMSVLYKLISHDQQQRLELLHGLNIREPHYACGFQIGHISTWM
jgi:hypothetical protein